MSTLHGVIYVTNLEDGETVHQRCILLTGRCSPVSDENTITICTTSPSGQETFPQQTWPVANGNFKALVFLSPGVNALSLHGEGGSSSVNRTQLSVSYVPLLQRPPLHLAIMLAKDSPCIIDCPPHKAGGISSAHSDLDAAVAKFRMTAYMWQAMTAEDMRLKGLGRRTFRLDEEWAPDTVSRDFLNAQFNGSLDQEGAMGSTAKIHLLRSTRSVAELRDADLAQQNPHAKKQHDIFEFFMDALREAEGPFVSHARPIVAGLILDSHYNASTKMIVGHAALGCHNPEGISLGMFGSHLTYAWPRFVEEVTSCLTDCRAPGDKVGNDNGECGSMWEACTIGQGAHLHEVGHAFGSPHRPGIMERGYAQDWPKHFLAQTAYSTHLKANGVTVDDLTPNNARWNIADALSLSVLPHFRQPNDPLIPLAARNARPVVDAMFEDDYTALYIGSDQRIARVKFNGLEEPMPSVQHPAESVVFAEEDLKNRFNTSGPLHVEVLGFNGRETIVADAWKLFNSKTFLRIPGSIVRLSKRSVASPPAGQEPDNRMYEWAQLLRERGPDGRIHAATSIDLCVGAVWDGGIVRYADGHVSHWGPMRVRGEMHSFGGHLTETIDLPPGVGISRIEVMSDSSLYLNGIRMTLEDGTVRGALNDDGHSQDGVTVFEPASHEQIVGFFGRSTKGGFAGVAEFGIITVGKDVGLANLPEAVFDMSELRNTCGSPVNGQAGQGRSKRRRREG